MNYHVCNYYGDYYESFHSDLPISQLECTNERGKLRGKLPSCKTMYRSSYLNETANVPALTALLKNEEERDLCCQTQKM